MSVTTAAFPERKIERNEKTKKWEVKEMKNGEWFTIAYKESEQQAKEHLITLETIDKKQA